MGLVRAALQRRPRQRLREPRQSDRVDDQPLSRGRAAGAARGRGLAAGRARWAATLAAYRERFDGSSCTRRWPSCGRSSGRPTRRSTPSSRGSWRRPPRPATTRRRRGCATCSATCIEACRLVGLAAAPVPAGDRAARCSRSSGTTTRTRPTGTAARRSLDELGWGVHAGEAGRVARSGAALPAARRRDRGVVIVAGDARLSDGIDEASATPGHPGLRCPGASRRQPLPPQRRPVRGRRRPRRRRRPTRRRRADPRPGLERRVVGAGARAASIGSTGSMPRSGSTRTTRPRSTTTAGRGSSPGRPTRGSWRSARRASTTTASSARSRTS